MKVKMIESYRGWKTPNTLTRDNEYDVPDDVARYLMKHFAKPLCLLVCECGRICKSFASLAAHQRKHK